MEIKGRISSDYVRLVFERRSWGEGSLTPKTIMMIMETT